MISCVGSVGGRGWGTIEGPTEARYSTIFGRFKVIFAQNVGEVYGRGEDFIDTIEERKW